jgi:hypothetical protein
MIRILGLATLLLTSFALVGFAGDKKEPVRHAAFESLKKLAGEWVALGKDGKPTDQVVSVYKVTAAGSAVHEVIFPGTAHEMITVYHLDGKDLVLTHFCAAKNQPQMKAEPMKGNKLEFKFTGGANIDVKKDMHMHEGTITFIDDNTIESMWQGWMDGKPDDGHKVSMKLVRKK